jgi:hypothetical protein
MKAAALICSVDAEVIVDIVGEGVHSLFK